MQKRVMATMVVVGCAVSMLTGCGVKQEIHDATIAELNTAFQEIETLKGTIVDKEADLDKERSALRKAGVELDSANERIKTAQAKEAETATALASEKSTVSNLESQLSSEKSRVSSAQQNVSELESELADLQEAYKSLQGRWKQMEENLNDLNKTAGPAKASAPAAADGDASAADLLSEMEGF